MPNQLLRFYILLIVSVLATCPSIGQSYELPIVPFTQNGKFGYMNSNKEIVVPAKFDEAYLFHSQRGRVKSGKYYGYLDQKGEMVIKCKYDEAADFKYGRAVVKKNGKETNINTDGRIVNETIGLCGIGSCCYKNVLVDNSIIRKADGKINIIPYFEKKGDTLIAYDTVKIDFDNVFPVNRHVMILEKDGKLSFANGGNYGSSSAFFISRLAFVYDDYKLMKCNICHEGISRMVCVKQGELWGAVDVSGYPTERLNPKYHKIVSILEPYFYVEYKQDCFGYVDYYGNEYFFWD